MGAVPVLKEFQAVREAVEGFSLGNVNNLFLWSLEDSHNAATGDAADTNVGSQKCNKC